MLLAPGLKAIMESIDNRTDFKTFMQAYIYAHGGTNTRGPRRNGPQDEGFVSVLDVLTNFLVLVLIHSFSFRLFLHLTII